MTNEVENTSKIDRDAMREIYHRAVIAVDVELMRWKKARRSEELDKVVETEIGKKINWIVGDGRFQLFLSKKDAVLRHAKRHARWRASCMPIFAGFGCLANDEEVAKELGLERVDVKFASVFNGYGKRQFFERQYKISVGETSTTFKCYFPNLEILTARKAEIEYANFICRLRSKAKQAKRWLKEKEAKRLLLEDLKSRCR